MSLSVALPIWLGVHLAWVNRDSATPTNTGFAAAAGGALIGAWLGFNATSAGFGYLAPFIAIVGSTVGANLALLCLDIVWDRQAGDPLAATDAGEALEASPSAG